MKKSKKRLKYQVELQRGGKGVCWAYAIGDLQFRTLEVPWKFIEIHKDVFIMVAICRKLKRIAVSSDVLEIGRRKAK